MEKWIVCKKCGHEYSKTLRRCPECGSVTPPGIKQILPVCIAAAALIASAAGFALGMSDRGKIETVSDGERPQSSFSAAPSDESGTGSTAAEPSSSESVSVSEAISAQKPEEPSENKPASGDGKKTSSAVKPSSSVNTTPPKESDIQLPSEPEAEDLKNAFVSVEFSGENVHMTYSKEMMDILYGILAEMPAEPDASGENYGFISEKLNADGSYTVVLTKSGYDRYRSDLKSEIISSIDEIKKAEISFLDDIRYSTELDNVSILIDSGSYNTGADEAVVESVVAGVGILSYTYRAFAGESDPSVVINVSYSADGEPLSVVFPDDFSE